MSWLNFVFLNIFELALMLILASSIFFWTRTVEWYVAVCEGRSWFVIYLGSILLIPVSPILYFTHARKYLKEQEKGVDKK